MFRGREGGECWVALPEMAGPVLGPRSIVPNSGNIHYASFPPRKTQSVGGVRRETKARGSEWTLLGRRPVGGGGCCGEGGGALSGIQSPAPVVVGGPPSELLSWILQALQVTAPAWLGAFLWLGFGTSVPSPLPHPHLP